MKMPLLIIFLFLPLQLALSFTLNSSTGRGFNKDDINIYIANTDCSGAGFSISELLAMTKTAVEDYWNAVPTSALKLNVKGISNIDIAGDTHTTALAKASVNTILAGCNTSATGFSNGGNPSSILGGAQMDCNGSSCTAVLILNAHADSQLPSFTKSEVEAVIAHEIGHAFGLGHSEYSHNLMYYSTGNKTQKWLGQDDIDGVTYLYPHDPQALGLLGACASLETRPPTQGEFYFSFFLGLLLIWFSAMVSSVYHRKQK